VNDTQYAVDLTNAAAGAAGCVAGGAPGGTHATTAAWSVLGGALRGRALVADLVPAAGDGSGWHLRTRIAGLVVDGTPTDVVPGATVAVGDWGTLSIDAQAELPRLAPIRFWAAALELRLKAAHAGLPAGTLVLVGYAAANRPPAPPVPPSEPPATTTTTPATTTTPTTAPPTTTAPTGTAAAPAHAKPKRKPRPKPTPTHGKKKAQRKEHRQRAHPRLRTGLPLTGTPPLGLGGYLFPVATGADWGDTYGGARSDVPGGWHHGADLFAPLGTPVVAVADGTVFAVGWNDVGGWRLWLVDDRGNEFYYAHLSGYTRLARDDARVRRGDVLAFVGNTGDAFTTDPHLHFEVHPNATLYLGYDGAVDPTAYLRAWPLPRRVHVLPPVELPGGAPAGFGSAADFRRLLAVHPIPTKPRPAVKGETDTAPAARPRRAELVGMRATGGSGHGDGPLPVVFAVVLLACGFGAVAHTARVGRT
jgi:murein DD-endopeptidase MepM/ murein hydrolase activator NlpD